MKLSNKDRELLFKALTDREHYKIVVDNDNIYLNSTDDESDYCDKFEDYGTEFIVKLLNTLGFNAEHC